MPKANTVDSEGFEGDQVERVGWVVRSALVVARALFRTAHRARPLGQSRAALDRCRRRQATVLALYRRAHHHQLCIGKFDAHDPTLPLILEVRAIRAPHQDEPRIGQGRRGGWVMRASFAPRLTTTPMLEVERKASPYRVGRAIVVNGRISCFAWLIGGIGPKSAARLRGEALFQYRDPLEPALLFTHEHRAGLQSGALARLRRHPHGRDLSA
jgi:hypothetical protein